MGSLEIGGPRGDGFAAAIQVLPHRHLSHPRLAMASCRPTTVRAPHPDRISAATGASEPGRIAVNPRISMITLGVRDLERSVHFYEQGLGLPRMESPPSVAFFTLNGTWLGLYGREALAEDAGVAADGSGFAGFALAHNVESDAEVDQLLAQAVAAGARLVKAGQKVIDQRDGAERLDEIPVGARRAAAFAVVPTEPR